MSSLNYTGWMKKLTIWRMKFVSIISPTLILGNPTDIVSNLWKFSNSMKLQHPFGYDCEDLSSLGHREQVVYRRSWSTLVNNKTQIFMTHCHSWVMDSSGSLNTSSSSLMGDHYTHIPLSMAQTWTMIEVSNVVFPLLMVNQM